MCATEGILQIASIDGATHGALIRMSRTEASTVLTQILNVNGNFAVLFSRIICY